MVVKQLNLTQQKQTCTSKPNDTTTQNWKMYFDVPVLTWLPSLQPAVTLTFDFQNLIRSSEGANGYSL